MMNQFQRLVALVGSIFLDVGFIQAASQRQRYQRHNDKLLCKRISHGVKVSACSHTWNTREIASPRYAVSVETKSRLEQLQKLHAADPADDFCIYSIAQEYASANELPLSLQWFEKLLAQHPTHAYGHYHYAKILERCERVDEAVAVLQRGLAHAKHAKDMKATSELSSYLDELTP